MVRRAHGFDWPFLITFPVIDLTSVDCGDGNTPLYAPRSHLTSS